MKSVHQYYIAVGLGGVCAVLGLVLLILGASSRSLEVELRTLQAKFEAQQEHINTAITISQQIIPNLFGDLGKYPEDVAFKALLAKHSGGPPPGK